MYFPCFIESDCEQQMFLKFMEMNTLVKRSAGFLLAYRVYSQNCFRQYTASVAVSYLVSCLIMGMKMSTLPEWVVRGVKLSFSKRTWDGTYQFGSMPLEETYQSKMRWYDSDTSIHPLRESFNQVFTHCSAIIILRFIKWHVLKSNEYIWHKSMSLLLLKRRLC